MSADDPIYMALAGTDNNPAVQGFNPGVGADLYTTNGEQTDYAARRPGVLAITPELERGQRRDTGSSSRTARERSRRSSTSTRTSRWPPRDRRPTRTTRSHRSTSRHSPSTLNFSPVDPQKTFNSMSDFTFAHSYNGASQPVQVLARRDLDTTASGTRHAELLDQRRSPANGVDHPVDTAAIVTARMATTYYRNLRAKSLSPGERRLVEDWFTGAGKASDTSRSRSTTRPQDVLILADTEDTGTSKFPAYTSADWTAPLPLLLHRRHRRFRTHVRGLRRRRDGRGPGLPGRALSLRRGDVVHGERHQLSRIAGRGGFTSRGTLRRRDAGRPRIPQPGRQAAVHGGQAGRQFANAFDYNPVAPATCDAVDLLANDGACVS